MEEDGISIIQKAEPFENAEGGNGEKKDPSSSGVA